MDKSIHTEIHKKIVKRLKLAREEARLDQIEVAKLLKKTQSYISKLEAGQRRIDIVQLIEFAKLYKKSLEYFIR